ncbi:BATF3 factor, partial [Polypterus senegalus]
MSRPLTGTRIGGVSCVPADDWIEAGPRNASLVPNRDPIGPEGVAQRRQASRGADGQDFETAVQDNITINDKPWQDVSDEIDLQSGLCFTSDFITIHPSVKSETVAIDPENEAHMKKLLTAMPCLAKWSNETEKSLEDDDKKLKRREKNRVAAQRSRKKQTQKADKLHEEYEYLEHENSSLQKEVEKLTDELRRLTEALKAHEPMCPLLHCAITLPSSIFNHSLDPPSSSSVSVFVSGSSSSSSILAVLLDPALGSQLGRSPRMSFSAQWVRASSITGVGLLATGLPEGIRDGVNSSSPE